MGGRSSALRGDQNSPREGQEETSHEDDADLDVDGKLRLEALKEWG